MNSFQKISSGIPALNIHEAPRAFGEVTSLWEENIPNVKRGQTEAPCVWMLVCRARSGCHGGGCDSMTDTQTRWQELYCFQDCLWWSIHLEVDNGHGAVYNCWRQTVTPVRPQGQEARHVSRGWTEMYTRRTLWWAGWRWEMNFVVTRIYNKMMTIWSVMT